MGKVRCFDGDEAIGVIEYTDNLDHWDGTQWQGERDSAEIVSAEEAKKTVLQHNPDIFEEIFGEPVPEL